MAGSVDRAQRAEGGPGRTDAGAHSASSGRDRRQRRAVRRTRMSGGRRRGPSDHALLDQMPLSPLLAQYDHVLLDLDGCVYLGDEPIPGAADALSELRAAGKSVMFLTNDARRAPEDYVRKLWSLGL